MTYVAQRIRCPVHNIIPFEANHFEDAIWRSRQTRPFQRLRRIKQLGFSDFVYPGATHSRFAHSVGVFHTARRLMQIVKAKVGTGGWNETKANAALAAALVHDVGHGPFSHAFEDVGRRLSLSLANHEMVSDLLIRESEISETFRDLGSGFAADVADVIKSKGPRSVYDAVVSSQFDADRLDYVQRDRLSAGTHHGVIDFEWLVSNIEVGTVSTGVDDQKVSDLETFIIGPKGIFAAEAYVLGLFQLYPTVYLHKATRGAEKLFTELVVRVFQLVIDGSAQSLGLGPSHPLIRFASEPTNLERAICLDDSVVLGALSMLCDSSDIQIANLALRLRDRKLFKCFDVREEITRRLQGRNAVADRVTAVKRITASVIEKVELWKKTERQPMILRDETSRPPYKRFEESKGPLNQIMVRSSGDKLIDLAEYSPVVASIPTFDVTRYYCDRDNLVFGKTFSEILDGEIRHGI